jgi:hypothetical protein
MKELKNIGTVLSIAVITALIFIVIWAYNNNNDHIFKIRQMEHQFNSLESHLGKSEQEKNDIKISILEITQTLREIQNRVRKNDIRNIYESLEIIESKLKGDDQSFSLSSSNRKSKKKSKRHSKRYESSDDSSNSDTDEDIRIELEKRKKKQRNAK